MPTPPPVKNPSHTSPTLEVYCPEGFSYTKKNELKVYVAVGRVRTDVTAEIARLIRAFHPDSVHDTPPYATVKIYRGFPGVVIHATHGESFGLEDWAGVLDDLFSVPVMCLDTTPYPKE